MIKVNGINKRRVTEKQGASGIKQRGGVSVIQFVDHSRLPIHEVGHS